MAAVGVGEFAGVFFAYADGAAVTCGGGVNRDRAGDAGEGAVGGRGAISPLALVGWGEADEVAIITVEEAGDSEIGVIRTGEGRGEIDIELGAGRNFGLKDEFSWFPAGGVGVGAGGREDDRTEKEEGEN